MAYHPAYCLKGKEGKMTISILDAQGNVQEELQKSGRILTELKEWMRERQSPRFDHVPDFQGGLLGFCSYDLAREIECLPNQSVDDLKTPDIYLVGFEQVFVYDHQTEQHWLIVYQRLEENNVINSYEQAQQKLHDWAIELEQVAKEIEGVRQDLSGLSIVDKKITLPLDRYTQTSFSEERFVEAVQQVQEYIAAGDVFQVNLSVRQTRKLETDPLLIYECLREINPSPYMGYLHYPDLQMISTSPEQLVKVRGTKVNTRPIAGTRPRGKDRQEDLQLAQELIENEKERAEHIMLVDLERNDLGKVCTFGSVEVNEFMVIEEYSHVMHIVSNVQGELTKDKNSFDVIEAVFPGGTITGAPKVRTMEIIEELEPVRRGIYTGSIGWIDYNGDMELNIVIRTMVVQDGHVHVQAGAGIVIDSVSIAEYQESLKKAEALWKAYELSKESKKEMSKA